MIMRTKKALRNKRRQKILPCVMIIIAGFLLVLVLAGSFGLLELKQEWYEGTDDDYYVASTVTKTGMTFNITNTTFFVVGVSLKIYRTETPGVSVIGIYNTNATGQPTTLVSENSSFNANDLGTDAGGTWVNITLPSAILINNTNYIILINHTTSGTINWRADDGGSYAYGEVVNYNSASAWSKPGSDGLFQVYGSAKSSSLIITLISPSDSSILSSSNGTFIGNLTPIDLNLTNATIYIWNSTHAIVNQTLNLLTGNITNTTEWNITGLFIESYKWNIYGCGVNNTGILCSWRSTNFTFDVAAQIDIEKWTNVTYETKNETFYINITVPSGVNLYAANLIYNGTSYLAAKTSFGNNRYGLSRKIDILLTQDSTEQNITFYWNFEYLNGITANQNTTTRSLAVKPLIFTICNGTYNPGTGSPLFVNYTIYNETDRTNVTVIMDTSFNFYAGEGSVVKNYSLDSTTALWNYSFCSNQNSSLYINPTLNLKTGSFYERTYYFIKEIYNNAATHKYLFLQDAGRNIIIQVKDSGLSPLKNYYIEIERYYPEINKYYIVEGAKTDIYGQFVARLIEPNTIKYRFTFKDSEGNIKKVTGDMTIACPYTTSCILPFIIEDTEDDFIKFENDTDYDWSLSYNNNTHKFTFTWNDISGKSVKNRLYVERMLWNGTTIVCNTTSNSKTGLLICDIGSSSASYTAQVFRKVGSDAEKRIGTLSIKVGDEYKIFGKEGLLWAFILLMTMIAVGYHYPPAGIMLYLVGFLLIGITHIIYISPFIMFGQLVIGIIFIWAFKKGRSG